MSPRRATSAKLNILVSEPTRLGCELLAIALKRSRYNFGIAGWHPTSEELIRATAEACADVVLISANLADGPTAGMTALHAIRARDPQSRCVVMMNSRNRELVVDAVRTGARGVIFRAEPFEMLCKCIRSVYEGQVWIANNEVQQVMEALSAAVPLRIVNANGDDLLSARQKQLVGLVTEGLTNREIAAKLALSEHTVKNYLFRIFDKLGVSSRAELIVYVMNQQDRAA